MKHVLVTNDFPPKVGGIQTLLYDWWRGLPPSSFAVLTSPYRGDAAFDAEQPFKIERTREPVLLPHPPMVRRVNDLVARFGADLVVLDPVLPLGLIGPHLSVPYDVVVQGAEVVIPGRLPAGRQLLSRVLRGARKVISISDYTAHEMDRAAGVALPTTVIPPGVDIARFAPLDQHQREAARDRFGIDRDALVVSAVSRLVPRKGFDVAIQAVARLRDRYPNLLLAITGAGRDESRLSKLAANTGAPVRFLGRVSYDELPIAYGLADVFTMLCYDRWRGLEQEGFGIVFLEAAACGVPQIAGRSGGAAEAVADQHTGFVIDDPRSVDQVAAALDTLLANPTMRAEMGRAARQRAVESFSFEHVAGSLGDVLGVEP